MILLIVGSVLRTGIIMLTLRSESHSSLLPLCTNRLLGCQWQFAVAVWSLAVQQAEYVES